MITGCAPFFLLTLAGVALGSWSFGTHVAARLTGLTFLGAAILYFALLNWTAQKNLKKRKEERSENGPDPYPEREAHIQRLGEQTFTESDRKEWEHYLGMEGRILWGAAGVLAAVIFYLIVRS